MKCVIECPICMSGDQDTDWRTLEECGHTFCYDCLEKSFHMDRAMKKPKPSCPQCRSQPCMMGIWAVDELTFKTFLPLGRQSEMQTQSQSPPVVEQEDVGAGERVETGGNASTPQHEASPGPAAGSSRPRRKTCAEWRQEVAAMEDRLEKKVVALEALRKDAVEAGVRASKEKAKLIQAEVQHKSQLDRKSKEVERLRKKVMEERDRFSKEHERLQRLQLQVANQSFFTDTNLDIESINRGVRGQDVASANSLLTSALAFRNQEYNKLQYRHKELREERDGSEEIRGKVESQALENRRLKDKIRKVTEDLEKLRRLREAPGRAEGEPIRPPRFGVPMGGIGSRGKAVPGFIDPGKQRSSERDRGSLIFDAPDGFGGKRKVPLRSLDQNAAAKRRRPSSNQVLSPHFGAAARSGKVPSARGGSGAIKLNGEALDPNRHAGLTMGHFFGRDR